MIKASELRRPEVLETVPGDKPGYYKWWAAEPEFRFLAEKLGADFDECAGRAEKNDGRWTFLHLCRRCMQGVAS